MRTIFALVLLAGVALAGFAVFMAQGYISQTQAALLQERAAREKAGPLVEVYVVNKKLNYGDQITKDDVQKIFWPQTALPETIVRDEAVLFPPDALKPRYVMRAMEKFEPVLMVKLTEPGQPAGLTGQLDKGQRAFAIKVDVASGVSGFLQPTDRVDIYWTGTVDGEQGERTKLIESTVEIIAVDQQASADNNGGALIARTVTVAATPEQVARLAQAQATGRLALSLVGTGDEQISGLVEVDGKSLLGIAEAEVQEVAAEPEAKVCTVLTRKGGEAQQIQIPCTN